MLRLLAISFFFASNMALLAVDSPEAEAFDRGAKAFKDGFFEHAEKELMEFRAKFPQSPHLAEATLLLIQAEVSLKKFDAAIELAEKNSTAAGALADRFSFWRAEALLGKGESSGDF